MIDIRTSQDDPTDKIVEDPIEESKEDMINLYNEDLYLSHLNESQNREQLSKSQLSRREMNVS